MTPTLRRSVTKWLQEEQQGRDYRAEKALYRVFTQLPGQAVPQGFADRVLLRADLVTGPISRGVWAARWGFRAVLSSCVILIVPLLVSLPSLLPSILGILNPGKVWELGVSVVVELVQRLGLALVFWRAIANIGEILTAALSTPPVLAALAVSTAVSIAAFRLLYDVIPSERRSDHAASV